MNSRTEVSNSVVSERLRFVDVLVKAGRLGDAVKEIADIKQINHENPYVQAYEERLQSIRPAFQTQEELTPRPPVEERTPPSPRIAHELSTKELADCVAGRTEVLLQPAEYQPAIDLDSADRMPDSHDPHSKGRASIVLVDDDEFLLEALVELLEDNKYRTKAFTKTEEALEYLKGHKPDLLLCDVNLRNSSFGGFSLFEKMTKLGHLHNVPFVFMSGLVDDAIIRAGKELGADDYLTKPFEPDMLLSVIKGKLRKYKLMEVNH
jgi:CheY-like chemotaxis protein